MSLTKTEDKTLSKSPFVTLPAQQHRIPTAPISLQKHPRNLVYYKTPSLECLLDLPSSRRLRPHSQTRQKWPGDLFIILAARVQPARDIRARRLLSNQLLGRPRPLRLLLTLTPAYFLRFMVLALAYLTTNKGGWDVDLP